VLTLMSAYGATLRSPNCGCSDDRAIGKGLSVLTGRALHNLAKVAELDG
jgi:hypothetical protein